MEEGHRADPEFYAAPSQGEGPRTFYQVEPHAETRPGRGRADPGDHPSLHSERTTDRIPNWILNLHSFSYRRYGRRQHSDVDGHDAPSACRDLPAVQVDLVRIGRWVVPGRGFDGAEFSVGL